MSVQSEYGGARGGGEEAASISRGERKQQGQAEASTAARVPAAGMAGALKRSAPARSSAGGAAAKPLRDGSVSSEPQHTYAGWVGRRAAERAAPAVSTRFKFCGACAGPSLSARAGGQCRAGIRAVIR